MQFQCPDGSYSLVVVDGANLPACASGAGTWVPDAVPFWQQELPADQVGGIIGSIMVLFAVAWLANYVFYGIDPNKT